MDTNIVIYLYSEDEPEKKSIADQLIRSGVRTWISTQVLSETANVLRRKFKLDYLDIANTIAEVRAACDVHIITAETVEFALRLGGRYGHSYFDSLILAAALECGCESLASEDMQNGMRVESMLTVRNPFA